MHHSSSSVQLQYLYFKKHKLPSQLTVSYQLAGFLIIPVTLFTLLPTKLFVHPLKKYIIKKKRLQKKNKNPLFYILYENKTPTGESSSLSSGPRERDRERARQGCCTWCSNPDDVEPLGFYSSSHSLLRFNGSKLCGRPFMYVLISLTYVHHLQRNDSPKRPSSSRQVRVCVVC